MKLFRLAMLMSGIILSAAFAVTAPAQEPGGKSASLTSNLDDQKAVAITIYNVNLGLVKDQREIKLPKGAVELRFMDVAARIIPASVHIKSIKAADSLQVLEQNYEYDLLNPDKLMDKYVGRDVKLHYKNPYSDKEETVTATLLSNNSGPIYKIGNEVTFGHPGRVIFPGVPENLISKPTLVWLLENNLAPQHVEATYLTNNITWRADYVVTLNQKDDKADLSGWVTIDNKSGTTYKNAKLKLVAGDVNRVKDEEQYRDRMYKMARAEAVQAAAPQFKEEEFFEYHIYSLQRPSTIKDNQTKQISLVSADSIPVKKELVLKGANHYYYSLYPDPMEKQKVGVYVEIQNKKEHNLGMPLPKGIIRVYKNDSDGSLQFVGEDKIDHTPRDEKVRIKLGDAFDVVGSRKQTEWKKISKNTYEASFEISLRNHKKEDVTVRVIEPVPGDWTMLNSSHPHTKTSAFAAEFSIPVAKDKETKLTYSVRMKY